jgi:hypothetical protein
VKSDEEWLKFTPLMLVEFLQSKPQYVRLRFIGRTPEQWVAVIAETTFTAPADQLRIFETATLVKPISKDDPWEAAGDYRIVETRHYEVKGGGGLSDARPAGPEAEQTALRSINRSVEYFRKVRQGDSLGQIKVKGKGPMEMFRFREFLNRG